MEVKISMNRRLTAEDHALPVLFPVAKYRLSGLPVEVTPGKFQVMSSKLRCRCGEAVEEAEMGFTSMKQQKQNPRRRAPEAAAPGEAMRPRPLVLHRAYPIKSM